MSERPEALTDAGMVARAIIERTGGHIRLALPLGLGKANTIVNALTALAVDDKSIRLDIFTALTLERPDPSNDLQRRFLEPAMDRLFGAYPPLDYAQRLRAGTLPDNIKVQEFFFQAGNWLGQGQAQQNYITANYTHALHYLMDRKPNVIAQLLARDGDKFSLSCNTDITVDLLRARGDGRLDFIMAGEVNPELPFMAGSGEVEASDIDLLLDDPATQFELFSVPKRPVSLADHAIGLNVAGLIRDGGTLQIGIGSIGDAIASALLLRHGNQALLNEIMAGCPFPGLLERKEHGPFKEGLYVVTEMLVHGIVKLMQAGIVTREVDGASVHAGFFVDCRDLYSALREMPEGDRGRIAMMPVSFTNQLYGDEAAKRAARRDARFVNSAMKATALGGVVSDMTEGGQIVSGVGGQFNFVDQAFALEGARSIITISATRESGGTVRSNVVWDHPHETIPRHLRDIIVTEYGVADLRGRSDEEAIMAMISIADSRFQPDLLERAKAACKLASDAVVPERYQANTPRRIKGWLEPYQRDGTLPAFPLGTDFTAVEQRLLHALSKLKSASGSWLRMADLVRSGAAMGGADAETVECLERMKLDRPRTLKAWIESLALKGALSGNQD